MVTPNKHATVVNIRCNPELIEDNNFIVKDLHTELHRVISKSNCRLDEPYDTLIHVIKNTDEDEAMERIGVELSLNTNTTFNQYMYDNGMLIQVNLCHSKAKEEAYVVACRRCERNHEQSYHSWRYHPSAHHVLFISVIPSNTFSSEISYTLAEVIELEEIA